MFEKNPVKVKFAVQAVSQSVANALLTLYELKVEHFENVHPTVDYLKIFNGLFDIMNSRNLQQKFGKAPLQEVNENCWKSAFIRTTSYICNLKTKKGKPVLHSDRYAAFLGIIMMKTSIQSQYLYK